MTQALTAARTALNPAAHLTVEDNQDLSRRTLYRLARIIYAETHAVLPDAEALASMIANLRRANSALEDISEDADLFECLNKKSERHADLLIRYDSRELQMCLRTLSRALSGVLKDSTRGAVRFHRAQLLPDWATSVGSVSEIGNLHFYI
ncbi:MAG: cell wall hydrolase [Alphaproteobacteria bacterium]|nr:cell wall hydrolase [Alphaproteobacteria bacterium]